MKHGTVPASELGSDWRPSTHLSRVRPVLSHDEATLIVETLEWRSEELDKAADTWPGPESDEQVKAWRRQAQEARDLASHVNNERIAAGG